MTKETGPHRLLRKSEVARELAVSVRTVERQIEAGRLAYVQIGRSTRIEAAELERFINALKQDGQCRVRPR